MRDKIKDLLDEKVNEVFIECQSEMGIVSGDITPEMALRLDEELDKLTEMIRDILGMQKRADTMDEIVGIVYRHGVEDWSMWVTDRISTMDQVAIRKILKKYNNAGGSVRGKDVYKNIAKMMEG